MSTVALQLDLRKRFLELIRKTHFRENRILAINITYFSEDTNELKTRSMLYDVETPVEFLLGLKKEMEDTNVNYNTVRATDRYTLIKRQIDMYAAIITHALENQEGTVMNVYLSNENA